MILGNFYSNIEIPEEEGIIIYTLVNFIKNNSTIKLTKKDDINHLENILGVLINISRDNMKNKNIIIYNEIIPFLLALINSSETLIWKRSILLLSYLCNNESTEIKNNIIELSTFNILYKKLFQISPPPPEKMLLDNYYEVYCSILGIRYLIDSNSSGITSFLDTPFIPLLLWTLDSAISLAGRSSYENIHNIQNYICLCFESCSSFSYENSSRLVEMKVIDGMMNVIEIYASKVKKKNQNVNEDTCLYSSMVIFNITREGFEKSLDGKFNKFKLIFEEDNKINRLLDCFKIIISHQPQSSTQMEILNYISISICYLLKSQKPLSIYHPILIYMNELKSSPSSAIGYDFTLAARNALVKIIDVEKCL
jgi:hypothetical protein